MANLVEIVIRSDDEVSFAGPIAKAAALKAALRDASKLRLDSSEMNVGLTALKSRIQALGIADLADVNVPPGKIYAQLQLIKRALQQSGITDILDVNVNKSNLAAQLSEVDAMVKAAEITDILDVNVDKGHLTSQLAEIDAIVAANHPLINVGVDIGSGLGSLLDVGVSSATMAAINTLLDDTYKLHAGFGSLGPLFTAVFSSLARYGTLAVTSFEGAYTGAQKINGTIVNSIPLWEAATGRVGAFAALAGKITLFAGAFGRIPLVGQIALWHVLVDSAVEFTAVMVPATVGVTAFGVAAIPTVQAITDKLKAAYTVSQAFGTEIYPLTGAFSNMAAAVQPEVYKLFGDMLVIANKDSSVFQSTAVSVGNVLDQLGLRATAALTSGGIGKFLQDAPVDVAKIGDIIANIFGTIGNLLKVVPGYAQILLTAFDDVTKALEALSASPIFQAIANGFLLFHGAALWMGLAATGAVFLGDKLLGLAATFGLVAKGTTLFNASQWLTGLSEAAAGVGLLVTEIVGLGSAADIAAAAEVTMEGAFVALSSISPVGWITLAIGALVGLYLAFGRAGGAADSYISSVQKAITSTPITSASVVLAKEYADTLSQVSNLQAQWNAAQTQNHTHTFYRDLNQTLGDTKAELNTISGYQNNYNILLKAAGGNVSALSTAGITLNDVINAGTNTNGHYTDTMKQLIIEVKAANDVVAALSLGTGRNAAAQNALNNDFITGTLPALQKVTQAEDALFQVITSGQTSFNNFQQTIQGTTAKFIQPSGLADAFKLAKGDLSGLSDQSLAFSNTLYSQSIPALQSLVDALQQQNISTGDLTKVIATGAGQMLQYTGNNTEARAVIAALINNALGPGTVSLQTLNKWVAQNSTSLTGMNAIVAQSTVNVATLANVLENDLNATFQKEILIASGAQQATQTFADAIIKTGDNSTATKGARDQLIADLEKAGFSARDATTYVNGLQTSIDKMHGKSVAITVTASGQGGIKSTISGVSSAAPNVAAQLLFGGLAAGGRIPGYGGGDKHLRLLEAGEAVVSKETTSAYADVLRAMGVPGMSSGGLVKSLGGLEPFTAAREFTFSEAVEDNFVKNMENYFQQQISLFSFPAPGSQGGPVSGSAAVAQAWALHDLPLYGWQNQWPALQALWNQESGWNSYAVNQSSGAYGIPQALPAVWGHPYALGDYQAQIYWGLNYIRGRYGGPDAAWAHEVAMGWYDNGGWLKPGWTMAYNGTGAPEPVGGRGGDFHITLELGQSFRRTGLSSQELEDIRYTVRTIAGGNVQSAFGKSL